jgi:cell division protein ZapA
MSSVPVELRVAGSTYRVVASAEEEVLQRLAAVVDAKVNELTSPGRQVSPQALLLAAISLAHELEEERRKRRQLEERARTMFTSLLERVDAALEESIAIEVDAAAQQEPLLEADSDLDSEDEEHPPDPRL